MSINLELTLDDYKNILSWYELAFARSKKQNEKDANTFKKLSVMCMTKIEELKENEEQKE